MIQYADVRKVSVFFCIVTAIADDEFIRNFKTDILHIYIRFAAFLLIETDGKLHRSRASLLQERHEVGHGDAGVDDILDHDDMLTADVLVKVFLDLDMPARYGAVAIARHTHGIESDRQIDRAHQVAEERPRPFQNADKYDILALIVICDLSDDFFHFCCDLLFRHKYGFDVFR